MIVSLGGLLEISVNGQFLRSINTQKLYGSIAHMTQSRTHIGRRLFKVTHVVGVQLRNIYIFRITKSTYLYSEWTDAFCG